MLLEEFNARLRLGDPGILELCVKYIRTENRDVPSAWSTHLVSDTLCTWLVCGSYAGLSNIRSVTLMEHVLHDTHYRLSPIVICEKCITLLKLGES